VGFTHRYACLCVGMVGSEVPGGVNCRYRVCYTGVAKDPGPGSLRLGWCKKYQLYVGIGSVGTIRT
jgi:hypothetical protein